MIKKLTILIAMLMAIGGWGGANFVTVK